MSIIRCVAVAAGALALAVLAPTTAAAETSDDPVAELRELCTAAGGDFFVTPYNRARCQNARVTGRRGTSLAAEQLICTDVLEGTFNWVSTPDRPKRVTWACI